MEVKIFCVGIFLKIEHFEEGFLYLKNVVLFLYHQTTVCSGDTSNF